MSEYLQQRQKWLKYGKPKEEKPKKGLRKISEKRQKELDAARKAGTDGEMDLFFASMRKRMKGKCLFCGGVTLKEDDDKFHYSIAHLLAKSKFKSVATHEKNWIELCHFGNSCHRRFDDGMISWEFIHSSKEWEIISEQLFAVLPQVAIEERKNKLYSKLESLLYNKK